MLTTAPSLSKTALRLAGAGIGTIVAGPLGAALGGSVGGLFSEQAAKLLERHSHEAGVALSEFGVHYCYEQFREMREQSLEAVVRQALRIALQDVHKKNAAAFVDWF